MAVLIRDIFDDENVVEQLEALYESCADFFEVHGISRRWAGEEVLLLTQMDPRRHLLGVFAADRPELIGAVEIMAEYPCSDCVTLASILLRPEYRRKGLGTEILRTIENLARTNWDAARLEIAVTEHERARSLFLTKNGFKRTERRKIDRREGEPFEVVVWEKHLWGGR